jgi:hypothetical protein
LICITSESLVGDISDSSSDDFSSDSDSDAEVNTLDTGIPLLLYNIVYYIFVYILSPDILHV